MIRRVITIDSNLCNGCGICVDACHEGAIGMIDGKAQLLRDDYCDGLGDCLPTCPTGAISFEEREALEFDKAAVEENMKKKQAQTGQPIRHTGCPGSMAKIMTRETDQAPVAAAPQAGAVESQLRQWPVQIQLVPVNAPYFDGANLLIAADCAAYAYADFHNQFIKNRITIIGCPKLDDVDYSEKLTAILANNNIKSITIVRMEVPCCGGIQHAATVALQNCGKMIPWQVVTISTDGRILE